MVPTSATVTWQENPLIGRTVLIGCTIGTVVAFTGIATAALAGGLGLGAALGLGVFSAFWGGLGFGGMLGGAAGLIQAERLDAASAEVRPAGSAISEPEQVERSS